MPEGAENSNIKSVLAYVGFDRLGDGLLKLPFVRGLRHAYPKAKITWLAGVENSTYSGPWAPIVDGLIDEVVEYGGLGSHPKELLKPPLMDRQFDIIFDTQRVLWVSLGLWRIPHKTFISPAGRFLMSSKKPAKGYKFPRAMQAQLMDLLTLETGKTYSLPSKLDLDPGDEWRALAAKHLPDGKTYVGFAPGSGSPLKNWPLEKYIALAQEEVKAGRTPVFILGPQEGDWRSDILSNVPSALTPVSEVADGMGTFPSPLFTIALAGRCSAAVANCSGTGHLLAVGGTPLITLYGPTNPQKWPPITDSHYPIEAKSFGGSEMHLIPLPEVQKTLVKVLGA